MHYKIKNAIYNVINSNNDNLKLSKLFDITIMTLIFQSIISVILSTFSNIPSWITSINEIFEVTSILIFTLEYLLRIWTADMLYKDSGKVKSRIKYIFSFIAIIDLIAILPFYLPFIIKTDLRLLKTLRLFRMLRILKLNRYITALNSIAVVLKNKKDQLISSISVVAVLILISSILMYYAEHDAQPETFENAFSGLWWAIATLTTVGYGDIFPITALGKIISAIIALLGIGLVAVPTGIISAGFSEEIENSVKDDFQYCPHCGKKLP